MDSIGDLWILLLCVITCIATPRLVISQPTSYHGSDDVDASPEKYLIRHLLVKYSHVTQHGRPVVAVETAVPVKLGLGLIQMELDEKEKALSMSIWARYSWVDEYLIWNPSDYSNISYVRLPSELIWIPDIMLYNTAETEINFRDTLVTVFYNGTILWVPHQRMKSSCSINVTNFPFDTQQCHMWFGSWTYTTNEINLTMAFDQGIDLNTFHADFKDTSQWAISQTYAERRVLPSQDEHPNYAVLTFTLDLKRNLVFASYILTLPCVFLACLTLVVFWLPPDRPDRTALAMSVFSSFLLLLLILVETAPPTASSVPSLGIYYCFNMVIIMLAVFLSSLVVNICQMGQSRSHVPKWIRLITIEGPLRYLCVCVSQSYKDSNEAEGFFGDHRKYEQTISFDYSLPLLNGTRGAGDNRSRQQGPLNSGVTPTDQAADPLSSDCSLESVMHNLASVYGILRKMEFCLQHRLFEKYDYNKRRRDWKGVAIVMDRLFFVVYVILIVLSICFLFPRPE